MAIPAFLPKPGISQNHGLKHSFRCAKIEHLQWHAPGFGQKKQTNEIPWGKEKSISMYMLFGLGWQVLLPFVLPFLFFEMGPRLQWGSQRRVSCDRERSRNSSLCHSLVPARTLKLLTAEYLFFHVLSIITIILSRVERWRKDTHFYHHNLDSQIPVPLCLLDLYRLLLLSSNTDNFPFCF